MDPISNADRIALLLREKLQAKAPASRKERTAVARQSKPAGPAAIAAIKELDDRSLARAFVQDLLVEQFGGELVNEAKFQRVVDRVLETIELDADGARLLAKVIAELREAAL